MAIEIVWRLASKRGVSARYFIFPPLPHRAYAIQYVPPDADCADVRMQISSRAELTARVGNPGMPSARTHLFRRATVLSRLDAQLRPITDLSDIMPFSKKSKETPKRQSERHPVVKPDLAAHVPYGFTHYGFRGPWTFTLFFWCGAQIESDFLKSRTPDNPCF